MINIKNHKTAHLFEPWKCLGSERHKLIDEPWAGLCRKNIFCGPPVNKIISFFTNDLGQPTKEPRSVGRILILQQTRDLSDEVTVSQLLFNLQGQ